MNKINKEKNERKMKKEKILSKNEERIRQK